MVTGDLVVRRASSSFVLIQTFGAQLLWHLDGPLVLITLQPGFANKASLKPCFSCPKDDLLKALMFTQ